MLNRIRLINGGGVPIDLSMVDINFVSVDNRETANCYVVKTTGKYMFPLVYGCGIKNGTINSASYYANTKNNLLVNDFYNYNNTKITSAYIETDTGVQAASAEVIQYDTEGYTISSCSIITVPGESCRFLKFTVSKIPLLGGNAIIAIKDGNGDIMWSWQIWAYPFTLSTLPHATPSLTYQILDVNLGWVKDSESSKYGSSPYYQWGRKDPLLRSGATAGTLITSAKATNYGMSIKNPTTFYKEYTSQSTLLGSWWIQNSTFPHAVNHWDSSTTTTGVTNSTITKTVYDPCPPGFSVPSALAFSGYSATNGGTYESGYTWNSNFFQALNLRIYTSGGFRGGLPYGNYWTAAKFNDVNNSRGINLQFANGSVSSWPTNNGMYDYTAYGFSIRPVKC